MHRFVGARALRVAASARLGVSHGRALRIVPRTPARVASLHGARAMSTAAAEEVPAVEKHTFQTETKQLLHIVANSLYTDKHVFIRELVSNASDALEKLRHQQVAGASIRVPDLPLGISIATDEAAGTLTITDTGIGMSKAELMDHLGTIAKSGSKAFIQQLQKEAAATAATGGAGTDAAAAGGAPSSSSSSSPSGASSNIIGQFGVGFYSAFMVAERVEVTSVPAVTGGADGGASPTAAHVWSSTGDGSYEVRALPGKDIPSAAPAGGAAPAATAVPARGTRIVLHLRESCREFASPATVRTILTRYSNFVGFPIVLNGKPVNTVGAIWSQPKGSVTEEQYAEFYRYKSGDFETPLYRLHFASDAPIAMRALLFVGSTHSEKFGMGRMKGGVDLYSRRVLIEAASRVVPDWMRFLHGVVDCEDIPLNISRESMQDSALMTRLRSVVTRRVIRFLEAEARRDPDAYATKFFTEFGTFLKEGVVTDTTYASDIAKLLRFESSGTPVGTFTSLDDYIARMPPGQQAIYYLVAPHRGIAETSPYMEAFKGKGPAGSDVEVLWLYSPLDDFVMNNLREYGGRKLVTAETAELDAATLAGISKGTAAAAAAAAAADKAADAAAAGASSSSSAAAAPLAALTDSQVSDLGAWMMKTLPKRLSKVKATGRLSSSPAVVTDHESAAVRRMMRMVEQTSGHDSEALRSEAHLLPPQSLEVNPKHPVIVRLHALKDADPRTAQLVAEQVVDNALVAAGLVDDARTMLPRLNALLEQVVAAAAGAPATNVGGYTDAATLSGRRFTSDRERDEREGLDKAAAAVDDAVEKVRAKEKGAAAGDSAEAGSAAAAGSATGGRGRNRTASRGASAGGASASGGQTLEAEFADAMKSADKAFASFGAGGGGAGGDSNPAASAGEAAASLRKAMASMKGALDKHAPGVGRGRGGKGATGSVFDALDGDDDTGSGSSDAGGMPDLKALGATDADIAAMNEALAGMAAGTGGDAAPGLGAGPNGLDIDALLKQAMASGVLKESDLADMMKGTGKGSGGKGGKME